MGEVTADQQLPREYHTRSNQLSRRPSSVIDSSVTFTKISSSALAKDNGQRERRIIGRRHHGGWDAQRTRDISEIN